MKACHILTVNLGSSSLKLGFYEISSAHTLNSLGRVTLENGKNGACVHPEGEHFLPETLCVGVEKAVREESSFLAGLGKGIPPLLKELDLSSLKAVGHRLVHGGTHYVEPTLLKADVLDHLETLIPLAPLHEPGSLYLIKRLQKIFPSLPHVGCFDTAFHKDQPKVAVQFALPRALEKEGIRRYGFHGLSCEGIMKALKRMRPELADKKLIIAHLGSGASLTAVSQGKSLDTTMGFSALEGLPMATRCGSLDVGVILYLLQEKKMTPPALQNLLYHKSGLLGMSGISGDVRTLLESEASSARDALEVFVYRIAREIGALGSSLQGLEGLIFTAGIGTHLPWIRHQVCCRLGWLGVDLDVHLNEKNQPGFLSTPRSRVEVAAIPTDEESIIADHTLHCIRPL